MKEYFESWNPKPQTLQTVDIAEEILEDYQSQGYTLTLRQLYYQFVARDLIENTERSYKNLGNIITKARMAGLLDWSHIEDRNREFKDYWFCENEHRLIDDLQYDIIYDRWARQNYYVEVWVEKEALGDIVAQACKPYQVPYMSCKGYLSSSEAYSAGKRFEQARHDNKQCVIIHLGDHDPSGLDMTRDNQKRVDIFSNCFGYVDVKRIALNMDQIEAYNPPPNPAKLSDSRANDYIKKYGKTSWELDALEPRVLNELITDEIKSYIDFFEWEKVKNQQEDKRQFLQKVSDKWPEIMEMLGN